MFELKTLLLAATGFAGGAINAVAGGATLFTFPALMAAGLPAVMANASSSMALTPGHFFGVAAEYKQLPPRSAEFWLAVIIMVMGGFGGALLLFATPDKVFTAIIPLLIGIATLTFAFGKNLRAWLKRDSDSDSVFARLAGLVPVSLYVGYFGAGAGVVMMALFAVTSAWALRRANAVKNLLGAVSNWAAIVIFVVNGMIAWPETLAMLFGAVFGGLLGGRMLRHMPAQALRGIIIAAGLVMTCIYAWRYWL